MPARTAWNGSLEEGRGAVEPEAGGTPVFVRGAVQGLDAALEG